MQLNFCTVHFHLRPKSTATKNFLMASKSGPSSKFAFDVTKPIKSGYLNKQGKSGSRFRRRFFVVYKGFLVYYDEDTKWRLDYSKGDTLESRRGAIKLKGGQCSAAPAQNVPKDCKYGFVVHAPDPINKRTAYLLDSATDEERESWVQAISGAIPKTKS